MGTHKTVEMMSKVWAVVFLSLLLIEPSASLALAEDSSKQSNSLSSGSSGGDDDNKTEGSSGMGEPKPMQIGAGVVLGLLVGGGGGSSSGAKGGPSASLPSSKKEEAKDEAADNEEEDGEGMFDGLFGSNDEDEAPKEHKVAKKAAKKH